jgi:hypothetical protein
MALLYTHFLYMPPELNLDGLSSLLTLAESTVDPTANSVLTLDCPEDMLTWYKNGGIASTIVDFWPGLMASGIEVEVETVRQRASRSDRVASKADEDLATWLMERYEQLELLPTLRAAETQCQIAAAAPILMSQDKMAIKRLTVLSPRWVRRLREDPSDQFNITGYEITYPWAMKINAESILPLYGRKHTALEWEAIYRDYSWGYPLVDTGTVKAANAYTLANHAASILIQKKNFLKMGIRGYLQKMEGVGNEKYAETVMETLRIMQRTTNLLNIQLMDLDDMSIESIERNVSGVADLLDRLRDMLLASCNNIPESRLFGRNRVGGISASNDDDERSDGEATRLFGDRWVPLIRQLNGFLLQERECPYRGATPKIEIIRKSSYQPKPLDAARTRLTNAQAATAEAIQAREEAALRSGKPLEKEKKSSPTP